MAGRESHAAPHTHDECDGSKLRGLEREQREEEKPKDPESGQGGPQVTSRRATGASDDASAEVQPDEAPEDTFGNEEGAEIQYKSMTWWLCGLLMFAENVSLGVLALPQAVAWLGIVPGLLNLFFLGLICWYTAYVIGQFKQAYPWVASFADCSGLIVGPIAREITAFAQCLQVIFIAAAHVLSFSIAINVLSDHGACTVTFAVVGMVLSFALGLPRTMKNLSYLSIFSCLSVFIAVVIAMIGIGIIRPDPNHIVAVHPNVSLVSGLTPVMNMVLAYAGHVSFFGFAAELKNPKDYNKALALMQICAITFYMVIATVIYYYAGDMITSPALGTASSLVRKVAFGVALPTIVVSGVINGSIACKYVYLRMWAGTNVIHQVSVKSIGSWVGICAMCWIISFVIAESIPNFNSLLALIGALFASWFSYGLPGGLWLYMNRGHYNDSWRKRALTVFNCGLMLLGAVMCGLGLWNSDHELGRGAAGKSFSCENNWRPSSLSGVISKP